MEESMSPPGRRPTSFYHHTQPWRLWLLGAWVGADLGVLDSSSSSGSSSEGKPVACRPVTSLLHAQENISGRGSAASGPVLSHVAMSDCLGFGRTPADVWANPGHHSYRRTPPASSLPPIYMAWTLELIWRQALLPPPTLTSGSRCLPSKC